MVGCAARRARGHVGGVEPVPTADWFSLHLWKSGLIALGVNHRADQALAGVEEV